MKARFPLGQAKFKWTPSGYKVLNQKGAFGSGPAGSKKFQRNNANKRGVDK